jgi:hypothetical protein
MFPPGTKVESPFDKESSDGFGASAAVCSAIDLLLAELHVGVLYFENTYSCGFCGLTC